MSAPFTYFFDPVDCGIGAGLRQPNTTLHLEGVILERLRLKKKARAGHASAVTTKSNELVRLSSPKSLRSKRKACDVDAAFLKLKEAHYDIAN